jgi:hypothetical protein
VNIDDLLRRQARDKRTGSSKKVRRFPHTHTHTHTGRVVGHYDDSGACDVEAPGKDQKIVRQRIAPDTKGGVLAEAPLNCVSRPFPASKHAGIGRYYSAGNSLQRRYVMGVGTIAEGQGAKGLVHEYETLRAQPQTWTRLKGYKGSDVATGPMVKGAVLPAGGPDDWGVGPIAAWQKGQYVETVQRHPAPPPGQRFAPYVPPK